MEAPQMRGVEEPLLPEPRAVEGRATQSEGAIETQEARYPRLHKTAGLRSLDVWVEISSESCLAIEGLGCPWAMRFRISRSRSVSVGKIWGAAPPRGEAAKKASTRVAIAGLKMASPLPTARIACTISSSSASLRT